MHVPRASCPGGVAWLPERASLRTARQMRSRTGCQTCRLRKLKCDERKPVCGPCTKANRECVFNSGLIFRHQQNASMNGTASGGEQGLKGFYAYKNTFGHDAVWLDIPKQVRFWNTTDPYNEPMSPESEASPGTAPEQPAPTHPDATSIQWSLSDPFTQPDSQSPAHALHALSAVATGDHFAYLHPPVGRHDSTPVPDAPLRSSASLSGMHPPTPLARQSIDSPISPPVSMTSTTTNHNIDFILNHPAAASPPLDPSLQSPYAHSARDVMHARSASSRISMGSSQFETNVENDHEMAYLLRYYSEGPGQWMDLFDLGSYFASYVPVKAQTNPVLKYAAIAYAAKALGRVKGKRPIMGGNAVRHARTELYPNPHSVDWYHKATEYYDNAVSLLRQALQDDSRGISHESATGEGQWRTADGSDGSFGHQKRTSLSGFPVQRCSSDELLAATAILCVYEFLDASGPEWSRHLSGAKSLIDIAKDSMMPLQLPSPGVALQAQGVKLSKARKATFWNVARQDMLSAFINASQTRLDTEDLPMWKDAGLQIDENGFIQPMELTSSGYPESGDVMKEDMIANSLVWLMSKLVNFMAAGDEFPPQPSSPWATAVPQRTLLDYWTYLKRQFQIWHDSLPLTFKPCARISPTRIPGSLVEDDLDAVLPEVWYSLPMCGSTMQSYHMSQVQLLMNKPHETTQGRSTIYARFNSVASFGTESSKSRHMVYKLKLQKIKTDGNSVKRHLESMLADVDEMERAFKTNMEWEPSFTNLIVKETPSLTGSPHTPSTGGVAIPAAHPAPTNNGPAVLAAPLSPRSYTPMNVSRDAGIADSADETPLPGSLQLEKGLFEAYNRGERAAGSSGGAWEM
ncbi:Structure-specific recognition protein [Neofusicoccum parvum]|uniref:Structure-specific recognition protein n=1 Tax=Neofusicoccum parvum TaxID=310453 RepID=A0ACB5RXE6_9PEZI|nr:Structure-specific recognition protein [Neofusicoccum parvum]